MPLWKARTRLLCGASGYYVRVGGGDGEGRVEEVDVCADIS